MNEKRRDLSLSHKERRQRFRSVGLVAAVIALSLVPGSGWSAAAGDDSPGPGVRSPEELARQRFKPLFDGKSLAGWDVKSWHEGYWVARDGIIDYDGKGKAKRFDDGTLWTKDRFGGFVLYVEWRLPAKPEMKPQPIVLFNGDPVQFRKMFIKPLQ